MHDESTTDRKVYVLVRADLPVGLQMAQAIHANVELALANPEIVRATPTVVVLSVEDEVELLMWADRLTGFCAPRMSMDDAPWFLFHEPDLEDHPAGWHTALAVVSDGSEFCDLPLAGGAMVT